jgi:hypothetical protein
MAMVREQDAFFAAGPALDWILANAKRQMPNAKERLVAGLAACLAFLVVFAPQAAAYFTLNGHLGPHASVGRKMNWSAPHALQVLFSPEHGFFVWTPLALLALAGLVRLVRQDRQVGICLLGMVALQIYVGGSVESWTVAGAYGQRRFIALTAALVIGYAGAADALRASPPARRILVAVTVLAVYWNLALIAEFSVGLMDRQRLEPRKNAYAAFVTLPRMGPSLVYRYLFDRGSFYKHGS